VIVPVTELYSSVLDFIKIRLFKAFKDDRSKVFTRLGCEVPVHKIGYPAFTQVGVEYADIKQIAKANKKKFFLIFNSGI
jgi:hypothetical protein